MNTEGFTAETARKLKPLGSFRNEWRRREVEIYEHPTDVGRVVTVGCPMDGGSPVVCVENQSDYQRYMGRWNAVYH